MRGRGLFTGGAQRRFILGLCFSAASGMALALPEPPRDVLGGGKLALTGGVTQVEGSGGGGLTPWALIGGNGTRDQIGGAAYYTRINLSDYHLDTYGALLGVYDRVEVSFSQQRFDTGAPGIVVRQVLGTSTTGGLSLQQDVLGLKVRLLGNAVLDQDSPIPQLALGIQYKQDNGSTEAVARAVGARDGRGTDYFLSATKLYLAQGLLANLTLRATRANQFGLLGFGGDRNNAYKPQLEGSLAWLVRPNLALGAEFRTKPDNLGLMIGGQRVLTEKRALDVFMAWAVAPHNTVTLAYVDLGPIAGLAAQLAGGKGSQNGVYLSTQYGF